ncbi:class I SAM-dependent methyltransferase [Oscillatoria sp. FACHB-1406]|uniref:class I SAM-dependent methyltransferase n=1 Tax=Oscillatoria sp. FACHB-1406 TaxID=2692846 RepID=UPI001688D179|nr:class I SAM-dependent methyltransferase [Oscillatoria sp. FACHB-1406]MBD2579820.1 class I SAM-dependent methyltransferase [Oscillatoria sp. FACHB-1406]
MSDSQAISQAVAKLYNTFPFPPDPLSDEAPPGYNWRWNWQTAYNFCTGRKPAREAVRILDAGCGTGSGTDYLIHLNPQAEVVAIDLSEKALEVAQERCRRSGVLEGREKPVQFLQMPLEEAVALPGEFDLINCVGVLHHLPNPVKGLQAIASKLAPGGLLHIFVYAELGRREIRLMQEAIALLQGDRRGDYTDGVKVGRHLFSALPQDNPIVKQDRERWSLENHRDEAFADMYVHPQEIDYNIETLFDLIETSGLTFLGFSNPQFWQLERLIGADAELMARSEHLGERDRYRLVELLDPSVAHYEFFLARPPLEISDWSDDEALRRAIPERSPCLEGWPSRNIFDFNYQIVSLSEAEFAFLEACAPERGASVGELLEATGLDLEGARSLQQRQLILLAC